MYHPLFSPMQDHDLGRMCLRKLLVPQPQVTDLLEAEGPGDAGFDGLKDERCCWNCDIMRS